MTGVVAALAMGVMAETSNTVTVTRFHQPYPYSGKATVDYTVDRALLGNSIAEITLRTDDASATFIQENVVTGANTFTVDFASSFGGALLLTNASYVVTIAEAGFGGVQLWANGPHWAECNVGAEKPEECGYYFWWGDTVGYTNTGSGWISVDDGTEFLFISSGTAGSTCYKKTRRFCRRATLTRPAISWRHATRRRRISVPRGACRRTRIFPRSSAIAPACGQSPTACTGSW